MPKKLAVLAAVLTAVLGMTTPALAQVQETAPEGQYEPEGDTFTVPPASEVDCGSQVVPQVAQATPQEEVPEQPATPSVAPGLEGEDVDESFNVIGGGDNGNPCTNITGNVQNSVLPKSSDQEVNQAPACGSCGIQVVKAAQDAITGGGSSGTNPKETFGAALDAARDAGGTKEAAASEEAGAPVEDTAAYQAAFEAATEAGADDESAKETAEQAVAEAVSSAGGSATGKANKASKVRKGGSGEGIAAAQGKVRKDRASKADDGKGKYRKDKARNDNASEEETTDEEVATSADNGGGGVGPTTPAGSEVPLLLGGVALLSVGGYVGVRFARSWTSVPGRRLLRN